MKHVAKYLWFSAGWIVAFTVWMSAQASTPANPPRPDPTHVGFIVPNDMKWIRSASGGQEHVDIIGDPAKPGLYIRLAKWLPGNYSRPHFHDIDRYFYVLSGTWWVSSQKTYDPATTYPMRAGTFVTHYKNTVHFDGANKDEPGVILEIGVGPMKSTQCREATDCPQP